MSSYVLGFVFTKTKDSVLLIHKNHPEWQFNHLNGLGGKLESCENPIGAMIRKFKEEAGLATKPEDWTFYATIMDRGVDVYCFACFNDDYFNMAYPHSMEQLVRQELKFISADDPRFVEGTVMLISAALLYSNYDNITVFRNGERNAAKRNDQTC